MEYYIDSHHEFEDKEVLCIDGKVYYTEEQVKDILKSTIENIFFLWKEQSIKSFNSCEVESVRTPKRSIYEHAKWDAEKGEMEYWGEIIGEAEAKLGFFIQLLVSK